jgi:hypothetical protein
MRLTACFLSYILSRRDFVVTNKTIRSGRFYFTSSTTAGSKLCISSYRAQDATSINQCFIGLCVEMYRASAKGIVVAVADYACWSENPQRRFCKFIIIADTFHLDVFVMQINICNTSQCMSMPWQQPLHPLSCTLSI